MRKENDAIKKEVKAKYALLRDAHVKEICEKVGEEHFKELQALKLEKQDLLDQNGKLGLAYRELDSRNKRQEDFIFDAQKKQLALE